MGAMALRLRAPRAAIATLAVSMAATTAAAQVIVAADDASQSAYNSGWFNGQSSGFGFSNWTVQLAPGASAGVASSFNNDAGEPGHAGINTGGRALRLVSGNADSASDALRTFSNGAMSVGQVFTIWIDNGSIVGGGVVGFGLQNNGAGNNRFETYFVGGQANYKINTGSETDTGLGFTRGGLRIAFQLTGTDTYSVNIVRDGAATANNFSGSLGGTAGSGIDKLRVFNFKAGANQFDDAFFSNNFSIVNGFVWDGGSSSVDDISRTGNWLYDISPISHATTTLNFAGGARLTPIFDSNFTARQINFNSGAGAFNLSRTGPWIISLGSGGIVNNSADVQTISVPLALSAAQSFDAGSVAGGQLVITSASAVNTNNHALTWTGSNEGTVSGPIFGNGSLIKTGPGLLTLSSAVTHSYSGVTTVTGGTLRVNGMLSGGGGAVTVGSGTPNTGILAGSGTVSRDVNINGGGSVAPGSGVAGQAATLANLTLDTGVVTLSSGGTYEVQVNRRADEGSAGTNWDHLTLSSLSVAATPANKFTIRLVSLNASNVPGALLNWDQNVSQTWTIATVPAANVSGFDPTKFAIDVSQFTSQNPVLANFYVWQDGNAIKLTYVPEPSSLAGGILASAALFLRRRRRPAARGSRG